jgi:hypothetical protein
MTEKSYYSIRTGKNPNTNGFAFEDIKNLFSRLYLQLRQDGYFDENFGFTCVDNGEVKGKITDVEYEILVKIRKRNLWPIPDHYRNYSEDDLFDIIEFLYQYVSKPIDGEYHSWNDCGMHWETFNKAEGQKEFNAKINEILDLYKESFALTENGEILHKPEKGFEKIFEADIPSDDDNVILRIESATNKFRGHGASLDDRRQAVRDLVDVLEYLKPQFQNLLTKKDENDLFNIANNFGIRHHNDKQKTDYDTAIWLSWMFYFYLSTIHVILRKLGKDKLNKRLK